MSKLQTPLRTSKQRSKTKKVSHLINKDSFLLVNNLKTEELSQTTIFKKNPHFTLYSDSEVVCKSLSRPLLVRQSLLMLKPQTPLRMSKPKFKTKKESHQINKDSSLPVNNLKTEELSLITTSKKNPLFTLSLDSEVECKSLSKL